VRSLIAIIACGVLITVWGDEADHVSSLQAKEKVKVAERLKGKNPTQENISKFMQAKLDSSKDVLEGLVTEDFALIEKGTKKMIEMSNATEWQVVEGPIFAQQSAEFRNAAKEVLNYAKKKNVAGASLSYLHLTMTCIACHKQIKKSVVVMK
jgi:nitrate/TMAO reductase-like tetraheme cytochrome c subunit